ncbi:MAG: DUF92 domain-containing protein [bacterium]|nr:DUF92 domain-containing protein [bacterium]
MEITHSFIQAILVNGIIAGIAYYTKVVRKSGIIGGLLVGIPIYYFLGYRGFIILFAMFILGTLATKIGFRTKQDLGLAEAEAGARGFTNVIAKCLPGVVFAFLSSFADEYSGFFFKAMSLGFITSFATGAFDTVSGEIGQVYGKRAFTLLPPKKAKPGTEGAISFEGTLAGLLAALIVILLGYWLILSQCPMKFKQAVFIPITAAIIANLIESILGSQFEQKQLLGKFGSNLINITLGGTLAVLLFRIL